MKKYILLLISLFILTGSLAFADNLKVGMAASDWSFENADGKFYSMESWAGKVLVVNYVDPDEADLNEHFTDALKKAKDEGRLSHKTPMKNELCIIEICIIC